MIGRTRFACWVIKGTDIYSKYVILIVFSRQQWLCEAPRTLPVLFKLSFFVLQFSIHLIMNPLGCERKRYYSNNRSYLAMCRDEVMSECAPREWPSPFYWHCYFHVTVAV